MPLNSSIDHVFVLSVKTFTDRIAHIEAELAKHQILFSFIFDFDAPEITPEISNQHFGERSNLSLAARSLVLKHIEAWRIASEKNYKRILVLEDDVILDSNFCNIIRDLIHKTKEISPGYLIFLGGKDTRVPKEFFLENNPLFKLKIPTTEGYITDLLATQKRLEWVKSNTIALPADHAMVAIDQACGIPQYWVKNALIEQGSVLGLFNTTLDIGRSKNSALKNKLLYQWKILKRRTIPEIYYKTIYRIFH